MVKTTHLFLLCAIATGSINSDFTHKEVFLYGEGKFIFSILSCNDPTPEESHGFEIGQLIVESYNGGDLKPEEGSSKSVTTPLINT